MGTFFIDWPLWIQMTFVLGASITVTLSMGVLKLFWSKHRLQRDTKAENEKMIEQLQMANDNLKDDLRTGRLAGDRDVPLNMQFGTEQLKYGGIYNNGIPNMSHPGTPRTSTFPTPNASFSNLDKLGKQFTLSTSSLPMSRPLVASHPISQCGIAHSVSSGYLVHDSSSSQRASVAGSTNHSPDLEPAVPYGNHQRTGSASGSVTGFHLDQPGRYPPAPAGSVPDLSALGLSRPLIPMPHPIGPDHSIHSYQHHPHHRTESSWSIQDGPPDGPQVLSPPSPYPSTFRLPQQQVYHHHNHPAPGFPGSQGV